MKLTRPAIAAVAAVAIAAGAIPVAIQYNTVANTVSANGTATAADDAHGVADQRAAAVSGAQSEVTSTLPASPGIAPERADLAKAAAAEPNATADEPATDPGEAGASVPDGDLEGLAEVVDEALNEDVTEADLHNMPQVDAGASTATPDNVKPLTQIPKDYQGLDQGWVEWIQKIHGGEALTVRSASMGRDIPVAVIRAQDASGSFLEGAPTYYLLNGAGGSEQNTDWIMQAYNEVKQTFENEPVNVVIPMEGAFSYYVDWLTEPEQNKYFHGKQLWSTFLGTELPNSIEPYMQANDKRAVSGFSMSATSSLLLAEHNPGRYAAVGSFSGCAATSTPLPSFFVGLTVNRGSAGKGNITPNNLWGPTGSEYNRYNDALVMAQHLRGTKIYLSSGTGLASESDMAGYLQNVRNMTSSEALANAATLQIEGGAIEAAMNACSHDLNAKLNALSIPVTFNQRPTGTHSWPLWKDDLQVSWQQVIKPALGL